MLVGMRSTERTPVVGPVFVMIIPQWARRSASISRCVVLITANFVYGDVLDGKEFRHNPESCDSKENSPSLSIIFT
jgi:hypothetical protein